METRWERGFFEEKFTEHDPWSTDGDMRPRIRFAAMVEMTRAIAPQRILDAGCGLGNYLKSVAEAMPGVELHGIDWSANALVRAQARLGGGVKLARADLLAYFEGEPRRRFDLAVFGHVLTNLTPEGLARLAAALSRHVADEAHLLIAEELGRHQPIQAALEVHGWRLVREFHLVEPGVWTTVLQHLTRSPQAEDV